MNLATVTQLGIYISYCHCIHIETENEQIDDI